AALDPGRPDDLALGQALARLYGAGITVDWTAWFPAEPFTTPTPKPPSAEPAPAPAGLPPPHTLLTPVPATVGSPKGTVTPPAPMP
ncbi:hypothetical protein ACVNF4_28950, partial [Streptomyces sp. S6]